ncbi:hypothetical protein [Pantoea sp. 18069]|uniref:hypothetical protein n=1 Tax=Pantoea sp. 18069 TaxID=2681415 RepID=UPI0013581104|nr:hypothetical protein [Pantoea sp. 18069]
MTDHSTAMRSAFSAQMQALDSQRAPGSEQPLELLLDDGLPLRVTLHPDNRHWLIEAYAYDAVAIHGPLRRSLVSTLLQINGVALDGQQILCTLDTSDLVVVMTRWRGDGEGAGCDFLSWLEYTAAQARRIREAVRAIAMHGEELDWQMVAP